MAKKNKGKIIIKRKNRWRALAVLFFSLVVFLLVWRGDSVIEGDHIARLEVAGLILPESERDKLLYNLAKNDEAKALLVVINSPGGSYVGGEALFRSLREFAKAKPLVVAIEDLATSAAYMAAIAADRIFVYEGSLTGSIGVIVQSADLTDLLERFGIKPESVKSSPLKAQPNPLEKFTLEARAALQKVVNDVHGIFVKLVMERRHIEGEGVADLFDGRVFSGKQAVEHGLVDAIGSEADALNWLIEARNIPSNTPFKDITPRTEDSFWLDFLKGVFTGKTVNHSLRLDGLLSVWQPEM